MDVSYLTLLFLIAHLCVHPAASSCKGEIEYTNLTGTELTAVENSRLFLEVRIPCENPVNKVTVTLSKQGSNGNFYDVCSIRQENGHCSSRNQTACRCANPNSSPGLYQFERTARLSDTAQWRVRARHDVNMVSFINIVVREASTTTARMTETRESDGQREKPSSAPEASTVAGTPQTRESDGQGDKSSPVPEASTVAGTPKTREIDGQGVKSSSVLENPPPFYTSVFAYGLLGLLALAMILISVTIAIVLTRKGRRKGRVQKRKKPERSDATLTIYGSDHGYAQAVEAASSASYDDIYFDSDDDDDDEEAHLRAQRPLPPLPSDGYLTPVSVERQRPAF